MRAETGTGWVFIVSLALALSVLTGTALAADADPGEARSVQERLDQIDSLHVTAYRAADDSVAELPAELLEILEEADAAELAAEPEPAGIEDDQDTAR